MWLQDHQVQVPSMIKFQFQFTISFVLGMIGARTFNTLSICNVFGPTLIFLIWWNHESFKPSMVFGKTLREIWDVNEIANGSMGMFFPWILFFPIYSYPLSSKLRQKTLKANNFLISIPNQGYFCIVTSALVEVSYIRRHS